jgi:peroxiredoxin
VISHQDVKHSYKHWIFAVILIAAIFGFSAVAAAGENMMAPVTVISGQDLISGKMISVNTAQSKLATVVVFVSSECPCSGSHEELLKKMASDYKNVQFIGVHSNADEPQAKAAAHFKKSQFNFGVIQDEHDKLADAFKAYKTPHAFVIMPNGEIVYAGGVTDTHDAPKAKIQFLRDALDDIKSGHKPRISEGRTLGCAISRS